MGTVTPLALGDSNAAIVDKMYLTCLLDQWVREIIENSLNEIVRMGLVHGEVEVFTCLKGKTPKIAFVDNGGSMSPEGVQNFINKLGCGRSVQNGLGANFGVGIKFAVMPRNKIGLLYVCKEKNQLPHVTHFYLDGDNYVSEMMDWKMFCKLIELPEDVQSKDDKHLHQIMQSHGTMVICLGNSDEEDTTQEDIRQRHWVSLYLSKRYHQFPEGVTVRVRPSNSVETGGKSVQKVHDQKYLLEKKTCKRGSFKVGNATINWGILAPSMWKMASHHGSLDVIGSFSISYNNENYIYYDRDNNNRAWHEIVNRFGIYNGKGNIIINIQLDDCSPHITRNCILDDKGQTVLADFFADDFQKNMPKEILTFMENSQKLSKASADCTKEAKFFQRAQEMFDCFAQKMTSLMVGLTGKKGQIQVLRTRSPEQALEDETKHKPRGRKPKNSHSEHIKPTELEGKLSSINSDPTKVTFNRGIPNVTFNTKDDKTDLDYFIEYNKFANEHKIIFNLQYPKYVDMVECIKKKVEEDSKGRRKTTYPKIHETAFTVLKTIYAEVFIMAVIDSSKYKNALGTILTCDNLTRHFDLQRFAIMKEIAIREGASLSRKKTDVNDPKEQEGATVVQEEAEAVA